MSVALSSEQRAELMRKFASVVSQGNYGMLDEIATDDVVYESPTTLSEGLAEVKRHLTTLRSVWDGLTVDLRDLRVEGEEISAVFTFSGLHVKDFLGIPASNQPFAVTGDVTMEIRDGRVSRVDVVYMLNEFFRQVDRPQ